MSATKLSVHLFDTALSLASDTSSLHMYNPIPQILTEQLDKESSFNLILLRQSERVFHLLCTPLCFFAKSEHVKQ